MKEYQRSHEPIAWSLFGAGGMVVAFIIPVLAVITGFLMPGWEAPSLYNNLIAFGQHWIAKIFLFLVISLTLYHTVHRIYHGLHDLHIEGNHTVMAIFFYGSATVLSIVCFSWLLVI